MRITRENVQELISLKEDLVDSLETAVEAAETWDGLQDGERNAETADEIRDAREALQDALDAIDVSSLCQLIHGKHKK